MSLGGRPIGGNDKRDVGKLALVLLALTHLSPKVKRQRRVRQTG
jgi:hypothetical protein